ncbi:MAG: helix-turn-helix domain-containing protein [Lachnospiraceae bacterium]|nr:helix-turn-helix domain-containing protein [Lachnospiraceae bacterium]
MEKPEKKMKDGIQLTIIEKIEALMDEHKISQAALARHIGIGQAQLSKCLSRRGGNHFSIDTLIKLSDCFRVPVDQLLGRTSVRAGSGPQSNADICRQLINLIDTNTVSITVSDIDQDTYQPNRDDPENGKSPFRFEKKSVTYRMFYFSNYISLPDMDGMDDQEKEAAENRLSSAGSYHPKGIEINAFIEYYLKLRDLYKSSDLPRAFFEQAIEDRLNQMRY